MEIDASATHKVVAYAILNHLIKGVQHVDQKVSKFVCFQMYVYCRLVSHTCIYKFIRGMYHILFSNKVVCHSTV